MDIVPTVIMPPKFDINFVSLLKFHESTNTLPSLKVKSSNTPVKSQFAAFVIFIFKIYQ